MAIVRALAAGGRILSGIIVGALLTYNYCLFTMDSTQRSSVTWKGFQDLESIASQNSIPHQFPREEKEDEQEEEEKSSLAAAEEAEGTHKEDINHRKNNADSVARRLKNDVRVLCWIMTSPENIATKAVHVNATWGRHCNLILFMSSKASEPGVDDDYLSLPIVHLDVLEGRTNLWEKTKSALKYIYRHHLRDADWFFKADDDTFAVVENLRYLLKDQLPNAPVYLGRRFKRYADQGYMSGGAGYVLSRVAVKKFVRVLLEKPDLCPDIYFGVEDVQLGVCLEKSGVKAMDTRDAVGRQRFHPLSPWDLLKTDHLERDFWLFSYDYYPTKTGRECCSDYTVTFHYIPSYLMYVMDFLVYRLRPRDVGKNCERFEDELDEGDFK